MIIAVSIGNALAEGKTELHATERAWALDIEKCREHDYVIGVEKGQIKGIFKLKNVSPDHEFPNRVKFELKPCSDAVNTMIKKYIKDNDVNLGGVQRGKYID